MALSRSSHRCDYRLRGEQEGNAGTNCAGLPAREEAMDCPYPGHDEAFAPGGDLGGATIELTADEVRFIEEASSRIKVEGDRYSSFHRSLVGR